MKVCGNSLHIFGLVQNFPKNSKK